ncbi:hypothetical protein DM02DRAFT_727957 [Periconia macrospinosa]|uniref:Nucleolar protein Dnt1-like N-terminal domain-containing protein n=1 Tax=Periconia macrospinosa TaxID=97972 RepID=A0A2V1DTE1_9PLEO|nr:hypothetical protein DM02DRAFT_727957 [Periconia macrospinosa]
MAAPNGRMRLTVEVLPLTSENAHGPNRAAALAEFKGRKFALPVQLDHTFEQVWQQIEERYKKNYLSQLQATYFVIKKLQDAYDCDLDIRDTVGDIFEGETDPQMRMIKVVPSFVNRDFSMPATSFLRPTNTHKRAREMSIDIINKRRRLEEQTKALMETDPSRDHPMTSTESARNSSVTSTANPGLRPNEERSNRSRSGSSLIFVQNAQTGNEEYGVQIKEESPELGSVTPLVPPQESNGGFKKPLLPASKTIPVPLPEVTANATTENEDFEDGDAMMNTRSPLQDISTEAVSDSADMATDVGPPLAPAVDSQGSEIRRSPVSTPDPTETLETQESNNELRNHREESEAPFLHQPTTSSPRITYGARAKSSLEATQFARKAAHMLNGARPQPTTARTPRSQPRTSDVTVEPPKVRPTPQQKPSSASQTKLKWPSEDFSDFGKKRRTDSPASSMQSSSSRNMRPTPNLPSQRATSGDNRDSIESSFSRNLTSSPLTSRTPRRNSSPKVVVHVRTPPARPKPIPDVREIQESPEPTPREAPLDTQKATVPPKGIERVKEQPTGPRRTPIPLPDNIRNLAAAQRSLDNGTSAATTPKTSKTSKTGVRSMPKAVSKGQKQMASVAADDAQTSSINPTGSQNSSKPLRSRSSVYDVPSSESPPPRGSVRSLVPKSQTNQPKRTPVPLPLNVRHIYATKTEAQRKATSSESDSSAPQIVSPTLNKRLTRASIANLGSASQVDKVPGSQSARKQAFVSRLTNDENTENDMPSSGAESSSTNSEEDKHGKAQSKGMKTSGAKGGHEKLRRELDTARKVFGKRPPDPVRNLEVDLANGNDADTTSNATTERETSSNEQLDLNEKAAMDSIGTHQDDEYRKQFVDAANEQIMQEETSRIAAATRISPSWGFDGVDSSTNRLDQADEGATSKPQEEPTVDIESGENTETDNDDVDSEESKANSAVQSTRSSPDVSRRPARYLSHSPTPGESDSEDDDQASSPSRAASSEVEDGAAESKDGDSTESSSDTESETSDVEQDTDMADGDKTAPPSTNPQPSSPLPLATQPVTLVPATQNSLLQSLSQPSSTGNPASQTTAETPMVPASQPTPSAFGSSQSISQLAAARRAAYSKFPSVKQQLQAARTSSASTQQSKPFDPRTASLGKLAKKPGKTFDVSDSSSDEDSSSSSSSDDEPKNKKKKNAMCSVA